jgi:hypothetical protein
MKLFALFETRHLGDEDDPPVKKRPLVNSSFEFDRIAGSARVGQNGTSPQHITVSSRLPGLGVQVQDGLRGMRSHVERWRKVGVIEQAGSVRLNPIRSAVEIGSI